MVKQRTRCVHDKGAIELAGCTRMGSSPLGFLPEDMHTDPEMQILTSFWAAVC